MCLDTKMSPKEKAKFKEQTEGWKVLYKERSGALTGDNFAMSLERPKGEWLNEKDYRTGSGQPNYDGGKRYFYGWHIWLMLDGARKWCKGHEPHLVIVKVKFNKPVSYGYQNDHPVVVAKEMMILEEPQ